MTTFIDNNGEKFVAENAKELVRQMASTSFGSITDETLQQYMAEVAGRAQVAASVNLRHDCCDNFIADMLIHGLLKTEQ